MNIEIPEIFADTLTGFIGQYLEENDADQFLREALETIYNQIVEGN